MQSEQSILTCVPLVYCRLFDYLSILELYRMRRVCKAWKECAESKIAIRESHYKAQVFTADLFHDGKPSLNSSWTDITPIKENSNAYKAIRDWKKRWTSVPRTGICVSNVCYKWKYLCTDTDNALRQWLPDSAKLLVIPSIQPPPNIDPDVNWRAEIDGTVYNFLSLPENSEQFRVEFLHIPNRPGRDQLNHFNNRVMLEIADPQTKLILSFHYMSRFASGPFYDRIYPLAVEKRVVVTGCIFQWPFAYNPAHTFTIRKLHQDPETVALSFKGENLRVSSLVIHKSVKTSGSLQRELEKLKITVDDYCKDCVDKCAGRNKSGYCDKCSSQMIAIMVASIRRFNARYWYTLEGEDFDLITPDFEAASFRRMIPNVPILGTCGYADAGMSMNLFGEENPVYSMEDSRQLDRTVFSILRFQ